MTRKPKAPQALFDHLKSLGIHGAVIVDGASWAGPYSSREQAQSRIGQKDSLDMTIQGRVYEI